MLKLDEKKIRKGRPIGLPYQGSKKKISKKIVEIIKQNFGTEKPIYDIFGGGGAITAECLINGLNVHYNDFNKSITEMFKQVVLSDREYLKTLIINREEFFKIKDKQIKSVDDNIKILVNSFGNNRRTYLYNKELSDIKYNLAIEIIKNHDTFSGYKKTETYIKALQKYEEQSYQKKQLKIIEQLSRLQQLGRLQQLECVQQLKQFEEFEVTNLDYKAFSNVENAILYLDPPYENTDLKCYSIDRFDSQSFYNWAYEMSKKNIVIISSYTISDDRFGTAYEFPTTQSTFRYGSRQGHYEKLFMPLWQLEKIHKQTTNIDLS